MSHVGCHFIFLGRHRDGSSEENEIAHNEFKVVYNLTGKRMDSLAEQPLTSRTDCCPPPSSMTFNTEDNIISQTPVSLSVTFSSHGREVIELCGHISGRYSHVTLPKSLSSFHNDGRLVWNQLKSVRFPNNVNNHSVLKSTVLFGGVVVYGKPNCGDGVSFQHNRTVYYGLWYFFYRHYS